MGTTKIILRKDVPGLGEEGDIKVVKKGYAMNYLYPNGFAVDYCLKNKNILEKQQSTIEKKRLEKKENAKALKEKLEGLSVSVEVPAGDKGRLYGTVTSMQIEEKITALGYTVDRKNIIIKDHIKSGGKYKIAVHLYNDIYADMDLEVIPVAQKEEKPERPQRRRRRYEDYEAPAADIPTESAAPAENAPAAE